MDLAGKTACDGSAVKALQTGQLNVLCPMPEFISEATGLQTTE
jgi:hypothetical protein